MNSFNSLHPEVKYIGFIILLYAGTSVLCIIYSLLIEFISRSFTSVMAGYPNRKIVTKFIQKSISLLFYNLLFPLYYRYGQSAGNWKNNYIALTFNYLAPLGDFSSTSETLRKNLINRNHPNSVVEVSPSDGLDNIPQIQTSIKLISDHLPIHKKPISDKDFGYYLAGLIDGDGCFVLNQLVIVFHELDSSLAYYIKSKLGFGNVYKIKNKKAVKLVISHTNGLVKILQLINGKLRTESKLQQIQKNILHDSLKFQLDISKDLNNYWLAGFTDADGSFQIKIIKRKTRTEIRLNYQVDQKKKYLLELIQNLFGGFIGYRSKIDCYYYGSISFISAQKVIKYFSEYHLLSSKYLNYRKWRKAYLIIQKKEHLTEEGIKQIKNLKSSMNSYSSEYL